MAPAPDSSLRKCSGTAILPAPDASPAQCSTVASSDDLVVVSHDGAEDPVFNYASKAALDLWEMDWETFTSTPSRFSAEPDEREARAELLRRVTEDGYVDDYCGVRISSSGKRFEVRDAYVWNVYDGEMRWRGVRSRRWFQRRAVCSISTSVHDRIVVLVERDRVTS